MLLPTLANALALGSIKLNSTLNEPFDASIEILSSTDNELYSLKVGLADSEAFTRMKIDRPAILSTLTFSLHRATDGGHDYIQISSQALIREPALNFLIEFSWSDGHLIREYKVLLDLPANEEAEANRDLRPLIPSDDTEATMLPWEWEDEFQPVLSVERDYEPTSVSHEVDEEMVFEEDVSHEEIDEESADFEEEVTEEEAEEVVVGMPMPDITPTEEASEEPEDEGRAPASVDDQTNRYSVNLSVDDTNIRRPGPPIQLTIEVGKKGFKSAIPSDMKTASTDIITDAVVKTAKVIPRARGGFTFEPEVSECKVMDGNGTTFKFNMRAKRTGDIRVEADVQLYDNKDCSGAFRGKPTGSLMVIVKVDLVALVMSHLKQIFDVTWDAFIEFWAGLIGFIFAAIGFALRKKIAAWFKKRGSELPDDIK